MWRANFWLEGRACHVRAVFLFKTCIMNLASGATNKIIESESHELPKSFALLIGEGKPCVKGVRRHDVHLGVNSGLRNEG